MTQREARALAEMVTAASQREASVEREGRYFVVAVEALRGRCTLRDEADWDRLRRQLEKG